MHCHKRFGKFDQIGKLFRQNKENMSKNEIKISFYLKKIFINKKNDKNNNNK